MDFRFSAENATTQRNLERVCAHDRVAKAERALVDMQNPGQPPGFCSLHDVYAAHANTGFLTFQAAAHGYETRLGAFGRVSLQMGELNRSTLEVRPEGPFG